MCGLAVLLSPLTKALDLLEELKISTEIHQAALQGKLCFALSQANATITTKADSRKAELQEKIVTSLPSMPRRPKPKVWSCIYGISLDSSCRHTVRPCGPESRAECWLCTEDAAVLGQWPWMLTEDVSGWALCSAHAPRQGFLPVHSQETTPREAARKGGFALLPARQKMKTLQITQAFKVFQTLIQRVPRCWLVAAAVTALSQAAAISKEAG